MALQQTGRELLLCTTEWEEELAAYSKEHPSMRVVDSFDAIRPIMSRFSMLAPLDKDGIRLQVGLRVPVQAPPCGTGRRSVCNAGRDTQDAAADNVSCGRCSAETADG